MAKAKTRGTRGSVADDEQGLTPAQGKLLKALLDGMNPVEAFAFVPVPKQTGYKWIAKANFQLALWQGRKLLEDAAVCSRLDLMRELWRFGNADIRQILSEDDNDILPPSMWPESIAKAVESIDVHALYEGRGEEKKLVGYVRKIRLQPKVAAITQLGKMIGAFAAPKAAVGPDGKPVVQKHRVVVVPAKRSEADMATHGAPPVTDAPLPAIEHKADELPGGVADLRAAFKRLGRRAPAVLEHDSDLPRK